MGKYRKFTPEYRNEAVKLVLESARPVAEVAWGARYQRGNPRELGQHLFGGNTR